MAAPPRPDLARGVSAATSGDYSMLDSPTMSDVEDEEEEQKAAGLGHAAQRIWDRQQLKAARDALLADLAECSGMEPEEVALCMPDSKWDKDVFLQKYYDDPDRLRSRLGVSEGSGCSSSFPADALCGICFCEPPLPGVTPCTGHGYCEDCWQRYVSLAIEQGKGCLELRCPEPKCNERLRASQVLRLSSSPALEARYQHFLLDSFVEDSNTRKWCPGVGCALACGRSGSGGVVECACGAMWCFDCCNDEHQPVPCVCVQEWNKKTVDSGSDLTWIMANTKPCPKCTNAIEKNGGCMHMTCRKPGGCGHEFCWICLGNWIGHQTCNAPKERHEVKNARVELLRYSHYWERFMAHEAAQKSSVVALREKLAALVACFVAEDIFNAKDLEFLLTAADQITRCRRFLKWTYAFAFFMKAPENKQKLFEFHQGQLEGTVERLSDLVENTRWEEYLEIDVADNKGFEQKRSQTVGLTKVVHDFFDSLHQWIQETFPDG